LEGFKRLKSKYNLDIDPLCFVKPVGRMESVMQSTMTLVTTCKELQDPISPELAKIYADAEVNEVAVGPLLDVEGAVRAAGHKLNEKPTHEAEDDKQILEAARRAKAAGRKVVLLSMGTVITGDSPDFGWTSRAGLVDRGLTGKELCQSAWAGAFDAWGASTADDGPLLILSKGPQSDALEGLEIPPNAISAAVLPQVDLLKIGVDIFLTHGGQNSFMEALESAVPVVVCPGFADQPVNARKAVSLGVGLMVDRPTPELSAASQAAQQYREDVRTALLEVDAEPSFRIAAQRCSRSLREAGGVPRAAELILQASFRLPQSVARRAGAAGA